MRRMSCFVDACRESRCRRRGHQRFEKCVRHHVKNPIVTRPRRRPEHEAELAICGIIPFSGFWSKDEILWRTASTNHIPLGWLLWIVATIAATCHGVLYDASDGHDFLGRYRGDDQQESHGDDHAPGKHEKHPHVPHESPKSMWVPLVVLAILATVGGLVGISTAFTAAGKLAGG